MAMRLLLTRPEPEATRSAEGLRRLGHSVILAPMMAPRIYPPPEIERLDPSGWLLTSAQAVRAASTWPSTVRWLDRPAFAVGDRTAMVARAFGFRDVRSAAGDMARLAALVGSTMDPAGGELLYPAARDRAGPLDERLHALGFQIRTIEAYAMDALPTFPEDVTKALHDRQVDGVLLYSPRTAALFMARIDQLGLGPAIEEIAFYAISKATAKLLPKARVMIASRADEAALWALLR